MAEVLDKVFDFEFCLTSVRPSVRSVAYCISSNAIFENVSCLTHIDISLYCIPKRGVIVTCIFTYLLFGMHKLLREPLDDSAKVEFRASWDFLLLLLHMRMGVQSVEIAQGCYRSNLILEQNFFFFSTFDYMAMP